MQPDISPDDDLLVNEVLFVSNGRQFVPIAGAVELEPGDILGFASAPLLRVPVNSIRHLEPPGDGHNITPGPVESEGHDSRTPQPASFCDDLFVHNVRAQQPDTQAAATSKPAVFSEASLPPQALLDRLDEQQRYSFLGVWKKLPPHLRAIKFDLHGPGWKPQTITDIGELLCDFQDVFPNRPLI